MDWVALGTIAEIVGAVAVVVSLIYLAAQIRHNSDQVSEQIRALELAAYDASAQNFSNFRLSIAQNPQLASLWRRGKDNFNTLTPDEQYQLSELFTELFWAYDNMLHRKSEGAIDEALWAVVEQNIREWLGNNGIKEWWEMGMRPPHSPEFEAIVNREYEKILGERVESGCPAQ
jgi:hypothetical protein